MQIHSGDEEFVACALIVLVEPGRRALPVIVRHRAQSPGAPLSNIGVDQSELTSRHVEGGSASLLVPAEASSRGIGSSEGLLSDSKDSVFGYQCSIRRVELGERLLINRLPCPRDLSAKEPSEEVRAAE